MSGKLFTRRLRSAAAWRGGCLLAIVLAGAGTACRGRRAALTHPAAAVEASVRPERFAAAFHKLGRAHFRSVARFEAGLAGQTPDAITTETDLWMDEHGNWRLVELNDKDGGREIVLHGRELSVALRYGKMIRRAAEEPEPQHLLEEGIGAPFAAWDLLRDVSTVDDFGEENRAGRRAHVYKLTRSVHPADPLAAPDPGERRSWRRTLVADSVDGTIVIDSASGLPLQADLRAQYHMLRPGRPAAAPAAGTSVAAAADVTPMQGAVNVRASLEDIGQSPAIARPESENLALRQRTVPEEKALLGGLPHAGPAAAGGPKGERARGAP